jgi:hypothetical protein
MTKYNPPLAMVNKNWSPQEISIAASMYQSMVTDVYGEDGPSRARGAAYEAIAQKLRRTRVGVWQRFRDHGPSFNIGGRSTVSASALTERSVRAEALHRRDLTASIFGDPPPGYSALDRRAR